MYPKYTLQDFPNRDHSKYPEYIVPNISGIEAKRLLIQIKSNPRGRPCIRHNRKNVLFTTFEFGVFRPFSVVQPALFILMHQDQVQGMSRAKSCQFCGGGRMIDRMDLSFHHLLQNVSLRSAAADTFKYAKKSFFQAIWSSSFQGQTPNKPYKPLQDPFGSRELGHFNCVCRTSSGQSAKKVPKATG